MSSAIIGVRLAQIKLKYMMYQVYIRYSIIRIAHSLTNILKVVISSFVDIVCIHWRPQDT